MVSSLLVPILLLSSLTSAFALSVNSKLRELDSTIIKTETENAAELPTQPGCYVTVPKGCPLRKEAEAHKAFLHGIKFVLDGKTGSDASLEACKGRRKDYNKQCGIDDAEMNFVDKEGQGIEAHFFEEKLGCFVSLPSGCPNDNTTVTEIWFEDTKYESGESKDTCKDRRAEWNKYCGVKDAKAHFAGKSANILEAEQAHKAESGHGPFSWLADVNAVVRAAMRWLSGDLNLVSSKDEMTWVPGYVKWDVLAQKDHPECPGMFVFVMSSRVNIGRRLAIRDMWKDADQGWGPLRAQFTVCSAPPREGEDPAVGQALKEEIANNPDIIEIDCEEGYTEARLTKKLIAAMHTFTQTSTGEYKLFMKTDDDTFFHPSRLCDYLSSQKQAENNFEDSYMGVFAEGSEQMYRYSPPCRDPDSAWYEPVTQYAATKYPPAAKGGPGYILSRKIVKNLLRYNIPSENPLNNEDKAMGVWVDKLKSQGHDISYINLPGSDGYDAYHDNIYTSGSWAKYPYALHHHLEGKVINCMYHMGLKDDDDTDVSVCFKNHVAQLSARLPAAHLNFTELGKEASLLSPKVAEKVDEESMACMSGA